MESANVQNTTTQRSSFQTDNDHCWFLDLLLSWLLGVLIDWFLDFKCCWFLWFSKWQCSNTAACRAIAVFKVFSSFKLEHCDVYCVSWFLCSWLWCANTTKEISTCAYICVFHLYLCLCLYLYLCFCLYLFRMWSQSPAQNLRFPIRALSHFHLYISVSVFLLYISVLGHCSVSLYHLHISVSVYHISMCISDIANPLRESLKNSSFQRVLRLIFYWVLPQFIAVKGITGLIVQLGTNFPDRVKF